MYLIRFWSLYIMFKVNRNLEKKIKKKYLNVIKQYALKKLLSSKPNVVEFLNCKNQDLNYIFLIQFVKALSGNKISI